LLDTVLRTRRPKAPRAVASVPWRPRGSRQRATPVTIPPAPQRWNPISSLARAVRKRTRASSIR